MSGDHQEAATKMCFTVTDWRVIRHRDDPAGVIVGRAVANDRSVWMVSDKIVYIDKHIAKTKTMKLELKDRLADHQPLPSGGRAALLSTIIENRHRKGLPVPQDYVEFATQWVILHSAPLTPPFSDMVN